MDNRSPRQMRHLSYIAEFSTDIRHIRGERNIVADALSRPSEPDGHKVPTVSKAVQVDLVSPPVHTPMLASLAFPEVPALDFKALAAAQDPGELLPSSDLQLQKIPYQGVDVWCDTGGGRRRPLVPLHFRRPNFDALHGLSHPGARPTIKLVSSRYVWPGMRKQVRERCRTCVPCQASKIERHTKTTPTVLPPASRRFGSIHVDLVGPLPDCQGKKYLLTIVDRFSRWPEAYP